MHEALCRSSGTTLDILQAERRAADHSANIGSKRCYGASDERTASSSLQLNRRGAPSPPSGWIEDLHLQAVDHARHITKVLSHLCLSPSIRWWRQPGSNR